MNSLKDALDPAYFDVIVECTKVISKFDPKVETYGAPSLEYGNPLERMC